jgi:hypothetical protein
LSNDEELQLNAEGFYDLEYLENGGVAPDIVSVAAEIEEPLLSRAQLIVVIGGVVIGVILLIVGLIYIYKRCKAAKKKSENRNRIHVERKDHSSSKKSKSVDSSPAKAYGNSGNRGRAPRAVDTETNVSRNTMNDSETIQDNYTEMRIKGNN